MLVIVELQRYYKDILYIKNEYTLYSFISHYMYRGRSFKSNSGPGWLNELGSWITQQLIQAYHKYGVGSCPPL